MKCSPGCAIWWTWCEGGDWFGAAYCKRCGWHVVALARGRNSLPKVARRKAVLAGVAR